MEQKFVVHVQAIEIEGGNARSSMTCHGIFNSKEEAEDFAKKQRASMTYADVVEFFDMSAAIAVKKTPADATTTQSGVAGMRFKKKRIIVASIALNSNKTYFLIKRSIGTAWEDEETINRKGCEIKVFNNQLEVERLLLRDKANPNAYERYVFVELED